MTKIELKDTRLKRDEALARVEQLEHTLEEEKMRWEEFSNSTKTKLEDLEQRSRDQALTHSKKLEMMENVMKNENEQWGQWAESMNEWAESTKLKLKDTEMERDIALEKHLTLENLYQSGAFQDKDDNESKDTNGEEFLRRKEEELNDQRDRVVELDNIIAGLIQDAREVLAVAIGEDKANACEKRELKHTIKHYVQQGSLSHITQHYVAVEETEEHRQAERAIAREKYQQMEGKSVARPITKLKDQKQLARTGRTPKVPDRLFQEIVPMEIEDTRLEVEITLKI